MHDDHRRGCRVRQRQVSRALYSLYAQRLATPAQSHTHTHTHTPPHTHTYHTTHTHTHTHTPTPHSHTHHTTHTPTPPLTHTHHTTHTHYTHTPIPLTDTHTHTHTVMSSDAAGIIVSPIISVTGSITPLLPLRSQELNNTYGCGSPIHSRVSSVVARASLSKLPG